MEKVKNRIKTLENDAKILLDEIKINIEKMQKYNQYDFNLIIQKAKEIDEIDTKICYCKELLD
jgi:hypothetical protein